MKKLSVLSLVLVLSVNLFANVVFKEVRYLKDSTVFKGFVAYDNAGPKSRPGILVVPDWWGINDFVKTKAVSLASGGYVVMIVDMYGNGCSTTDPKIADSLSCCVLGTRCMRERSQAALEVLAGLKYVDDDRLAAIGFGFGGTAVLDLAYSGADLKGVATFGADLITPQESDSAPINASFLIMQGADDPTIQSDSVVIFQDAMRDIAADWQMIYYGNALHSFADPAAGDDVGSGNAYDISADQHSWEHLRMFLEEALR
jgi:dienelactone hydrolase